MKKSLIALAAGAVLGLTVVSSALATPIILDNGIDVGTGLTPLVPNGSTRTTLINSLGYSGTLATSIYLGNPSVAGTTFVDTNEPGTMGFFGFGAAGSRTTVGGATVQATYPDDPGQLNINTLNMPAPAISQDRNGFQDGEATLYSALGAWGLSYRYTINGMLVSAPTIADPSALAPVFTGGYFDVFYRDGGKSLNDFKKLLRLDVTGSVSSQNNLLIRGYAGFDFDSAGSTDDTGVDTFVQDFFRDGKPGGGTFYQNYIASGPIAISWALNTNVDPPVPSINDLWDSGDFTNTIPGIQGALIRQSELNGTIKFNVPEPGSLALLGLALAGFGLTQRRRKAG